MKQIKSQLIKVIGSMIVFLPVIILFFSLTSCSPVDSKEILNSLMPNTWLFLAHVIASIVLIVVLLWLVYKPASKAIQKRKDYINQQFTQASDTKKQADMALVKANSFREQAISEAATITANAKNKASLIIQEAKASAREESKQIKKQVQIQLSRQEKELKRNIHNKIVDTAFVVAEEILKKNISKDEKQQYVDDILNNIAKDSKYEK